MPQFVERMIDSGLDGLLDTVVDGCTKGFPQRAPPLRLGDVGSQGWNLPAGDLDTPVAVLKASALDANIAWMSEFLRRAGASLCPHGRPRWPRSSFIGSWPRVPGASPSQHHSRLAWPTSTA